MKWEYKQTTQNFFEMQSDENRQKYLNEEGENGWELLKWEEDDEIATIFWFKRIKED